MSTSILEGLVLFHSLKYPRLGTAPMDTTVVRDGVANGLHHAADSFAQVRVNFASTRSAVQGSGSGLATYETIEASPSANQLYHMGGSPFGPWPLTLAADGTPARLRVRVGGLRQGGAGVVTFHVVIATDFATARQAAISASSDSVFEAASSSGTNAWLSGTSQGSAAAATYIQVSADEAREWTYRVNTYDAVSAASPTNVEQCIVSAFVFGSTSSSASVPRMTNLYIAEYTQP